MQKANIYRAFSIFLHAAAHWCRPLLLPVLLLKCCGFCCGLFDHACGSFKLVIRNLQVMLHGYFGGVPQPRGDSMDWKIFHQFGFPAAAEIDEQLGPRRYASPLDDSLEVCP